APEAVDRLLRIADDEELPRYRSHPAPVALGRIVGREQEQDLRLQRIRVLELVDQEMGEPPLQVAADGGVAADEITGAQQEVEEVEAAGALLQPLVILDHRPQLVAQPRRQVRTGGGEEGVETRAQR